jgi:hypothetical protein
VGSSPTVGDQFRQQEFFLLLPPSVSKQIDTYKNEYNKYDLSLLFVYLFFVFTEICMV